MKWDEREVGFWKPPSYRCLNNWDEMKRLKISVASCKCILGACTCFFNFCTNYNFFEYTDNNWFKFEIADVFKKKIDIANNHLA